MTDINRVLHDFKNLVQWRYKIEHDLKKVHHDFEDWSNAMDQLFLDLGMQTKGTHDCFPDMFNNDSINRIDL